MRSSHIRTLLLVATLLASLLGIIALSGSAGAGAPSHQRGAPIPIGLRAGSTWLRP